MFDLTERAKIVPVEWPQDKTGAALTTEYISLKNAQECTFLLMLGSMSSTSNQAVTLKVADDASGTHNKAITSASAACTLQLNEYWKTSSGDTLAKQSVSSSTFNLTKSSDNKIVLVKVKAENMGTFVQSSVTYNADYVALSVATPGAHTCLASCMAVLTGLRYAEDTPPTAIT